MSGNIVIPGPSMLYVQWGCRRCGHKGGIAKTTIPVTPDWNEEMMRNLFDTLRRKLVNTHARHKGCIATFSDFDIAPYVPEGKTLLDRI